MYGSEYLCFVFAQSKKEVLRRQPSPLCSDVLLSILVECLYQRGHANPRVKSPLGRLSTYLEGYWLAYPHRNSLGNWLWRAEGGRGLLQAENPSDPGSGISRMTPSIHPPSSTLYGLVRFKISLSVSFDKTATCTTTPPPECQITHHVCVFQRSSKFHLVDESIASQNKRFQIRWHQHRRAV